MSARGAGVRSGAVSGRKRVVLPPAPFGVKARRRYSGDGRPGVPSFVPRRTAYWASGKRGPASVAMCDVHRMATMRADGAREKACAPRITSESGADAFHASWPRAAGVRGQKDERANRRIGSLTLVGFVNPTRLIGRRVCEQHALPLGPAGSGRDTFAELGPDGSNFAGLGPRRT